MRKRIECGFAGKAFNYEYLEWIQDLALAYGLNGTTFLKGDGSIEVIAEGEEKYLHKLAEKLERGHFWHSIENFYIDWFDTGGEYSDFHIKDEE